MVYIMWRLLKRKNAYGEAHNLRNVSRAKKIKLRMKMIKYALFYHHVNIRNVDALILNHERRVWNEDHYECIYTDDIAKQFDRAVVLERPYQQSHFRPVDTKNLVYTDWIEVMATAKLYFNKFIAKKKYIQIKEQVKTKIQVACDELSEMMHVSYDLDSFAGLIADGYFLYHKKKKMFAKLIERYQPKVILEVVSYNMDCMIVNELAENFKIPTIELQHGATGREHLAYNYPDGVFIRQFPQYYFSFSQFWCEEARYPIPLEQRKNVGFPHIEKKMDEKVGISQEKNKVILFISQGPIGEVLSNLAVELNKRINREEYKIIYKLHPGEYTGWRERYMNLANSDIEVVDSNKVDLYELFAISNFQVGGYGSTAIFEGLYFGLITCIYEKGAVEYLQSLCRKGIALPFQNVEELYKLIQENPKKEKQNENFWTRGALQNIMREIQMIVG